MKISTLSMLLMLLIAASSLKAKDQGNHLRGWGNGGYDYNDKNENKPQWEGKKDEGEWKKGGHKRPRNNEEHPFPPNSFDWSTFTSPCVKEDVQCWQKWFSDKLSCQTQDKQCLHQSLHTLPCFMMDKKCWTDHISSFPCKTEDTNQCWDNLFPSSLKCKFSDKECWKNLRKSQKGDKKLGKCNEKQNEGRQKKRNVEEQASSDEEDMQIRQILNHMLQNHMKKNKENNEKRGNKDKRNEEDSSSANQSKDKKPASPLTPGQSNDSQPSSTPTTNPSHFLANQEESSQSSVSIQTRQA